jgi:nuclear transport factor 2 (NTF2) superfamily protein
MSTPVQVDGRAFAERWVAEWNARDVDAVVNHYAEDCVFVSPKAATITGHAEVHGSKALRRYWQQALARYTSLEFRLRHAVWDAGARTLAIVYEARLSDLPAVLACEVITFGDDDRAVRGEAFYGASL